MTATAAKVKWKGQIQGRTGWRLFFACLLCGPLAGLAIMFLIAVIGVAINASSGGIGSFPPALLASGAMFGAIIGWPAALVFGLPAHSLLYRRKSHRIGGYLLAGVLAGFAASAVIIFLLAGFGAFRFMTGADITGSGFIALIIVLASAGAAAIFWFIRRPDRDVMQPDKLAAMFE
jgi:hypothetical protein